MTAIPTSARLTPFGGRLYDPGVVLLAGALMAIGVAMVYSASVTVQGAAFDWRQLWRSPLKQGVFAAVGFVVMLIAAHVDYRIFAWDRPRTGWRAGLLTLAAAVLLLVVFVPGIGRSGGGARRAIEIPGVGFSFQPSEFAKVALVVWLAALMSRTRRAQAGAPGATVDWAHVRSFWFGFVPALVTASILIGLTAIEDFGTAALMGAVMLILLFAAGARWWHLGLTLLLAPLAGAALVILKPHRRARLATFFSDNPDLLGGGYQVHQGLLAIGSGGWWGRGLGQGVQKYGYLPKDNNDFILAIICEELGIVGGAVVVLLFLLFLWRGWRIASRAPDRFGQLLALGLTLTICLQAAFNIAVVTNSVPTKGISLPFVSAGGSGVIFLGLAAGLLAAVGRQAHARE